MSVAESEPPPLLASSSPAPLNAPQHKQGQYWASNELPLIGRAVEVAQTIHHLKRSALVTLVGLGGSGKTRLAAQIAQELTHLISPHLFWVEASGIHIAQELEKAAALAFGISPPVSQSVLPVLAARLRHQPALLILDGFEYLIDQVAWLSQLQALAANAALRVLVTSRERLNLPEEIVVELHGLSTQPSDPSQANSLSPSEELFLYHASKVQSGYVLTAEERLHVRHICALVNGIPLAIELAASWMAHLPAKFIAEQIQRNLDWLTTSVGLTHNPQKSMRAAIEYFWMTLSAHEQHCLRQLAVFRDCFDPALAREVTNASAFFLSALVERALLVRHPSGRYMLHNMLRQFAEEQLNQNPAEAKDIRQQHAQAMSKLLNQVSEAWRGQHDLTWLKHFDIEQANLRAAIRWAIANNANDLAIQMATQMSVFYQQLGQFKEGSDLLKSALAILPNPIEEHHFHALLAQAELQFMRGEMADTVTVIQRILRNLSSDLSDHDDLNGQALTLWAEIETRQGDYLGAQRHAREAVQVAQHSKNIITLANAMQCEGHVFQDSSNYGQATQAFQNALVLHQRAKNQQGIAAVHLDLGRIYQLQKEINAAIRAFNHAHTIYERLGNRLHTMRALLCMSMAAYEQRDFATARTHAEKALAVFKELGAQEYIVHAHVLLGSIMLEQNQNPEAHFLLGLDGALRLGLMPCMLVGLCGVARSRMHNGRNTSTVELLGLLLSHVASTGAIVQEANTLLAQLRRLLSHNEVERHLASGQRRNLHQTVRELLAEGTIG